MFIMVKSHYIDLSYNFIKCKVYKFEINQDVFVFIFVHKK